MDRRPTHLRGRRGCSRWTSALVRWEALHQLAPRVDSVPLVRDSSATRDVGVRLHSAVHPAPGSTSLCEAQSRTVENWVLPYLRAPYRDSGLVQYVFCDV